MVNFTRTEDRRQRTEKIKGKCKNKSYGSPTKTLGDDGYGFPTRTLGNDKSGDRGQKTEDRERQRQEQEQKLDSRQERSGMTRQKTCGDDGYGFPIKTLGNATTIKLIVHCRGLAKVDLFFL